MRITSRKATGWKRAFDDPIALPRGRQLVTLEDAANYIQKLPEAEQLLEEWQAAVEALLMVVETAGNGSMIVVGPDVAPHSAIAAASIKSSCAPVRALWVALPASDTFR